jgi:hypothetical protein
MYKVEITRGWDGESRMCAMVKTITEANQWIADRVPQEFKYGYWRYTVQFPRIIDYGSWTYFGRITELEEPSDTEPSKEKQNKRNKPMSKKKPYSRVECGKLLRALRRTTEKAVKKYTNDGAPEWYIRLAEEHAELAERMLKLSDFLYVQETKESAPVLSDEANAVCPKALKLLFKQVKAMATYDKILISRIELGWPKTPGVCECKKDKVAAKKAKKAE